MPRLLKLRVVIAIALGGLVLGSCSSDADEPAADPTPSTGPTSPPEPPAECSVAGFVPRTSIKVRDVEPVVVWAHRVTLAPTSSMSSPDLDLARADLIQVRVRPTDRSVKLPAEVRRQILESGGGPVEDGSIAEEVRARVKIRNDSNRNRLYLAYRGSFVHTGDWTVTACGAPYNDGAKVEKITGTYSTVAKVRPVAVTRCGAPTTGSDLEDHAAEFACRDF